MRPTRIFALCAALLGTAALADDIVTMPTANQLKAREFDAAVYYISLSMPAGAPQYVQYQTLYLGLTDRLELDLHRAAVDNDAKSVVVVGQYKLLSEGPDTPDLVVGVRNLTGVATTNSPLRSYSRERSVYLATAKTWFVRKGVQGPPLIRLHTGIGSRDYTLMNEPRHEGAFGGIQCLFTPTVGAVVQHDGQDWITGLTYMPPKSGITLKLGTYGDHSWYGAAYRMAL
ncbi:MAG: hypothetical protein NT029_14035 [Armatimonadetes bacterium]|nr:hypothetical protein [Armatimonadota bacterium]